MSRRQSLLHLLLIATIWAVDLVSKSLAEQSIRQLSTWGPLSLTLQHNQGAMLGVFANLPAFLRVVCLSTGGAFLLLIYVSLQLLLQQPLPKLRLGLTLLMAGILGNLTDRIGQGAVTDFLVLNAGSWMTPAFNLADIAQWVGALLILFVIFEKNPEWRIYGPNNRRRMWVSPTFQMRYIAILVTISVGFMGINMVFFSTYLRSTIQTLIAANSPAIEDRFLIPFYLTFSILSAGFLILLILLGRILSHRVAGPLYAFETFLQDLLSGKNRDLKLRPGDEFKHLEELARQLRKKFEEQTRK